MNAGRSVIEAFFNLVPPLLTKDPFRLQPIPCSRYAWRIPVSAFFAKIRFHLGLIGFSCAGGISLSSLLSAEQEGSAPTATIHSVKLAETVRALTKAHVRLSLGPSNGGHYERKE
jgi:hypothetical protein